MSTASTWKTDEFAEWYAKEKLGLIHKNEIIFKGE